MSCIVISQPMFFPWVGLFEQIRLADVYVHYDDAQFSKGSFVNRVQIKTDAGSQWLTVPLRGLKLGQTIAEAQIDERKDWRNQHLQTLARAYAGAPRLTEMLQLVEGVYHKSASSVADVSIASIRAVCDYFELGGAEKFCFSSALNIGGRSSQKVLDIVKCVNGTVYVTGHGARDYLDHSLFDQNGIRVEYMNYEKKPYPQLHGDFTPFVSILDLIANVGQEGRDIICSGTTHWKEFAA